VASSLQCALRCNGASAAGVIRREAENVHQYFAYVNAHQRARQHGNKLAVMGALCRRWRANINVGMRRIARGASAP